MEFTCQMCQTRLSTADIARQTLKVPTCSGHSHRGPFEPIEPAYPPVQTRPAVHIARNAVQL